MIKNFLDQEDNQSLTENEPKEPQNEFNATFADEENNLFSENLEFAEIKSENEAEKGENIFDESIFVKEKPAEEKREETLFQTDFKPDSPAETIRKSGLAYSAAIVLFSSVIFMLILGWFFDLLIGTKPWGIVGGIVLGAIIGFYQFFRLTSQIFNDKK